jgi:hypothetical protein
VRQVLAIAPQDETHPVAEVDTAVGARAGGALLELGRADSKAGGALVELVVPQGFDACFRAAFLCMSV